MFNGVIAKVSYMHFVSRQFIKIDNSETTEPILNKHHRNVPWMVPCQIKEIYGDPCKTVAIGKTSNYFSDTTGSI